MFRFVPWKKTYDQDLKKNVKIIIEVHYLSREIKISTTRDKQHSKIHAEFKPWDGCQMVNT